jgi:uncharacterized protein YjeT (DUF2065 family)
VWFERGARLVTLLALLTVIAGLLVLALPNTQEGRELLRLDAAHSLNVADLVGAGLVTLGALLIWVTALAWQRKRLQ